MPLPKVTSLPDIISMNKNVASGLDDLLNPDGNLFREGLNQVAVMHEVPGYAREFMAPGARQVASILDTMFKTLGASEEQLAAARKQFIPDAYDTEETAAKKWQAMQEFMSNAQSLLSGGWEEGAAAALKKSGLPGDFSGTSAEEYMERETAKWDKEYQEAMSLL